MKRSSWINGKEIKKSPKEIFSKLINSTWERNPGFDLDFFELPYRIKVSRVEITGLGVEVFFFGDNIFKNMSVSEWQENEFSIPITFDNMMVWYSLDDIQEENLSEAAALSRRVHNIDDDFVSPIPGFDKENTED